MLSGAGPEVGEPVPNPTQLLAHGLGMSGMVASAHPRAALVGVEMLRRGGTVADAALAMAFAEWVLLPGMCGMGGDALALVRAKDGRIRGLLGAGSAPAGLDLAAFQPADEIPSEGAIAATVPGAVDACWQLHQQYGRLEWADLIQPAVDLARIGFPVTERVSMNIARSAERLLRFGDGAPFLQNRRAPEPGRVLVQNDLARALERVARDPRDFYEGEIARSIVAACRAGGSPMTADDLGRNQAEWADPVRARYRGWDVIQLPPPTPGLFHLQQLLLLSGWDLSEFGHLDAQVVHLMVEAKKLAFGDLLDHLGDPRRTQVPVERLLSEEYLRERRRVIDPLRAGHDFPSAAGCTSFLAAADAQGNAVAFIHSLSRPEMGCGVIVPGTGIVLNSRGGRSFTLSSKGPNALAGGVRPATTLNAFMIEREGRLRLTGGTPGGDQQLQWNFQAVVRWIDFGLSAQQTVESVRWHASPGTDPRSRRTAPELWLEDGFPPATIADLERMGHRIRSIGRWGRQGAMQLIEHDYERGVLKGATDPRASGLAIGF
jgi:gamma-glutamyltranspeptidase